MCRVRFQFFLGLIRMELAKRLRPITKEEAKNAYDELKEVTCKNIGKYSRIGLKCLDHFFLAHRVKAKTKHGISFAGSLKDKVMMDYIDGKIEKIKKVRLSDLNEEELLRQRYSVFQLYYGTINQFRPTEVIRVYCALEPKVGVLDFSAGWGGRCLGTMAYGVPYIGIDANKNMEKSYKEMIELVKPVKDVKMIFKPSETVDFSKFKYDLVFTSPPYFTLEEYENMPEYGSKDGFIEKFFRPVVTNAWKHLAYSGHMALNMPKDMYDAIKGDLPRVWKKMLLPIANRHPTNAITGKAIGETNSKERTEVIYVWKKLRTQTRKIAK
jgi:hypothetical protein